MIMWNCATKKKSRCFHANSLQGLTESLDIIYKRLISRGFAMHSMVLVEELKIFILDIVI